MIIYVDVHACDKHLDGRAAPGGRKYLRRLGRLCRPLRIHGWAPKGMRLERGQGLKKRGFLSVYDNTTIPQM